MTYQLVASTGDTAAADSIKDIADAARRILIQHAGPTTTTITITTPTGTRHPFSQNLASSDLPPDVIAAEVDELLYQIRAGLHWEHDQQG